MLFNSIEFALFPQLVAGLIERATNLLPQFLSERRFDYADAVNGCRQMLWGFFKDRVPEECWLDANHLNANGAKLFTPMLLNAVRRKNLL